MTAKKSDYAIHFGYGASDNLVSALVTSNGTTGGILSDNCGNNYLFNCSITESTEVSFQSSYSNDGVFSTKHDQTLNNDIIFLAGAKISKQSSTTQPGSGYAWKTEIKSANRNSNYKAVLSLAKIAVVANKLVTVKAYMKKDHATNIACELICLGGQIAGVDSDVYTEKANDTNWEELTITFTPSEAGVVEILQRTWFVATGYSSSYVDTMTITQAD